MKLKTAILELGIGALVLTGCGGTGSDLPKATGKIAKEDAKEIQRSVLMTGLDPVEMLQSIGGGAAAPKRAKLSSLDKGSSNALAGGSSSKEWEGEHTCSEGGIYTRKIVSGVSPYDHDSEVDASKLVFTGTFKDCVYGDGIKRNGVKNYTWDWTRDYENRTWKNNWSGSTEGFIFEIDATHKFTTSSSIWSGVSIQNKAEDEWSTISGSDTKHYVRSGTLVNGDATLTFKNITRDKSEKYDNEEMTFARTWEISGAIRSDDLEGWIIVDTPVAVEKNSEDRVIVGDVDTYCSHAGKTTISGVDHVITTEAYADHSIKVKYDDEVIAEYANCIEYNNDNH